MFIDYYIIYSSYIPLSCNIVSTGVIPRGLATYPFPNSKKESHWKSPQFISIRIILIQTRSFQVHCICIPAIQFPKTLLTHSHKRKKKKKIPDVSFTIPIYEYFWIDSPRDRHLLLKRLSTSFLRKRSSLINIFKNLKPCWKGKSCFPPSLSQDVWKILVKFNDIPLRVWGGLWKAYF